MPPPTPIKPQMTPVNSAEMLNAMGFFRLKAAWLMGKNINVATVNVKAPNTVILTLSGVIGASMDPEMAAVGNDSNENVSTAFQSSELRSLNVLMPVLMQMVSRLKSTASSKG